MQVWAAVKPVALEVAPLPKLVIPVNSGFEAVMLTGVYARPSGSIGGALGSVQSANTIGAPFVTRVKGSAILPNSWRVADISDCFLGGSAVANLSAERATVIANKLSCVTPSGEVYEASIKAYGVDIDGIQGLAGKVVSKQGAVLGQAFLVGIASGLGSALSPTAIPGYNSGATAGTTQYQQPNPAVIAQTAVGQGLQTAASQLSKFYLDFARELFPVVEVVSGTRVTWILLESAELTKIKL
jgi:conjugal transfer pilus assembly protein TraB